jgi:small subunit ribosomal protein S8e
MAVWHLRSKRKQTGKRLKRIRKKRRSDRGSPFAGTRIEERRAKAKRTKGGNTKVKLQSANIANVADPKSGKITKSKILTSAENPANPHYVRRNIMTRGAIIKTEAGMAKVTSRPGQHGAVNAVLMSEKK